MAGFLYTAKRDAIVALDAVTLLGTGQGIKDEKTVYAVLAFVRGLGKPVELCTTSTEEQAVAVLHSLPRRLFWARVFNRVVTI